MRSQRLLTGVAASAVLLMFVACGNGEAASGSGAGAPPSGGASVGRAAAHLTGPVAARVHETDNLTFTPSSAAVKVGEVVHWVNTSGVAHNVTFDSDPSLTSPTMSSQDTWDVAFTTPGTYHYHCTFHPGMTGTITVTS